MENKNLRSSDILTGIILAALGVFIIIYSINLSRGEIFYTSAGFLPLLLGVFFAATGVYLAINGHRKGGSLAMFTLSKIMDAIRTKQGINTIFILAWLALYIFVFLNILPYFIATFLYLVVMMVLFYFMLIRPENKRKKEAEQMRSAVKTGDKITTIGGIVGTVVNVKENNLVIETGADQVRIEIAKWAMSTNETAAETAKAEAKKAQEAKAKAKAAKKAEKGK